MCWPYICKVWIDCRPDRRCLPPDYGGRVAHARYRVIESEKKIRLFSEVVSGRRLGNKVRTEQYCCKTYSRLKNQISDKHCSRSYNTKCGRDCAWIEELWVLRLVAQQGCLLYAWRALGLGYRTCLRDLELHLASRQVVCCKVSKHSSQANLIFGCQECF
jgi:hypothetical protein